MVGSNCIQEGQPGSPSLWGALKATSSQKKQPRAQRRSGQGTTQPRLLPDGWGMGAWLSGVPFVYI